MSRVIYDLRAAGLESSKPEVIMELWRHAKDCPKCGVDTSETVLDRDEIAVYVGDNPYFRVLKGRMMYVDVRWANVDLTEYNRANGVDGVAILNELRARSFVFG